MYSKTSLDSLPAVKHITKLNKIPEPVQLVDEIKAVLNKHANFASSESSLKMRFHAETERTKQLSEFVKNQTSEIQALKAKIANSDAIQRNMVRQMEIPIQAVTNSIKRLLHTAPENLSPTFVKTELTSILKTLSNTVVYRPTLTKILNRQDLDQETKGWLNTEFVTPSRRKSTSPSIQGSHNSPQSEHANFSSSPTTSYGRISTFRSSSASHKNSHLHSKKSGPGLLSISHDHNGSNTSQENIQSYSRRYSIGSYSHGNTFGTLHSVRPRRYSVFSKNSTNSDGHSLMPTQRMSVRIG